MNKDLRKRLEDSATEYAINDDSLIDSCDTTSVCNGFLAGAECGYKEAIEVAKGWLAVKGVFSGETCGDLKQYIIDFESYMTK